MQMTPQWSLMMVAVVLVMGASQWRRKRIKRAARDLPTRLRRLLGPEPEYAPPDEAPEDDGGALAGFAALHRRTERVMHAIWVVALLWVVWVLAMSWNIFG